MEPVQLAALAVLAIGGAIGVAALRPAWIVARPWWVIGAAGAVTLAALAGLGKAGPPWVSIRLDPSSEPLLPLHDPGRDVYRAAVASFGSDDVYVVAMETDDAFAYENLAALRRVTDAIRRIPGVRGAESLTNVVQFRWDEVEEWSEVSDFVTELPTEREELDAIRRAALADPLYPKTLVSADARTAAVNVTFRDMTDGEFVELDVDGHIRAVLDAERAPGRRFFVSGRPHVRSEGHHLMLRDILTLIPFAIVCAVAVLWCMTGSASASLVPLVACVAAMLWALGGMTWVGIPLNLITLVLGPMLVCVGGVYGVHVYARYEMLCLESGSAREAALRCLEYSRAPVLMAGLTTVMGFGALLLADIRATNEFAAFSILGVASITVLSVTAVPAVLSRLPLPASRAPGERAFYEERTWLSARFARVIAWLLERLADLAVDRSGAVSGAAGALLLASVALLPRITVDTDFLTFFLEDSRVRRDFDRINELMTGTVPIYVTFRGDTDGEGRFRDPVMLRAIERIQRRIESIPEVHAVLSATDLVRVANRSLARGNPAEERIPDTRAELAEVIFLIPKQTLRRFATSNHSSANLIVRAGELGSAPLRRLEAKIREAAAAEPLPPDLRVEVTGNSILINRSADGIAGNQVAMVGLAATTMLVLTAFVFRSLRVGLLAMVPNVVPVLLFFGMLGLGAAPLSLATSLIGCLALGIAVDDTMHFLVAFRRLRARGLGTDDAARECVRQVGRPVVMTSVVLVVGFLVITAASFATLREFGTLTALTMGICLGCDLVLLPALLIRARA